MMTATEADSRSAGSGESAGASDRQSVQSPAASSGIRRLDPVDGLFLRAEHLDQIQRYAAELMRTGTLTGGPGTVYGYTLDLDEANSVVGATSGLAVDPSGRLLRSLARLQVDLSELETGAPGRIWIVEVVAAEPIASGNEPVYGALCPTGCGPGSSIQPWLDDTVRLRVRAQTLDSRWRRPWWDEPPDRVLSALVSAYFERERRDGTPWLTPGSSGAAIAALVDRPWSTASPSMAPTPSAVPLGLLARIEDRWVLDTWSARRDRIVTPPESAWQHHLSLRTWPIFVAQVLQFEDQLSRVTPPPDEPLTAHFTELPPAGFLPVQPGQPPGDGSLDELQAWAAALFGGVVDTRVHLCSADVALSAVAEAQHMDRIPLADAQFRPRVDIWLPTETKVDLQALRPERYGWLAFTRGRRIEQGRLEFGFETRESVGVYVHRAPVRSSYQPTAGRLVNDPPLTTVAFAAGGWDMVPDADAVEKIREEVEGLGGFSGVEMVAGSAEATGTPLLTARTEGLAAALGLGDADPPVAIYPTRIDGPDAIVLMVRRPR
jgi:hypothetical protein